MQVGKNADRQSLLSIKVLQPSLDAEHSRYAGAMKIDIHQAYIEPFLCQRNGKIGSYAALAHAALAAHDQNLVFYLFQTFIYLGILNDSLIIIVYPTCTAHY
ncbi:MAG: hypothetical protein A4E66_02245 [Syntrophus sp. PtaB.Bin001]|nr:MAG: hypothetical protein A4E66_02245 [Syntrophus sp. PtaB.Bin001]